MGKQIPTSGKGGMELSEYNGTYSLTALYEGKNGQMYQKWGKEKIGKGADGESKYADTDRPFKIVLGDRHRSIDVLRMLLAELAAPIPVDDRPPLSDDSIPF
jgi:hypothetical protein